MGSCVSRSPSAAATAKVMELDGSITQYAAPVTAHEALGDDENRFLCSSDELQFDEPARALAAEEALQPGWLYLVLPLSMLRRPISGQDMAALAVKASSALAAVGNAKGRKAAHVAPLVDEGAEPDGEWSHHTYGKNVVLKTVHGSGNETVEKTRKGAGPAGYRSRSTHRPCAGVKRLGAILEADCSE